MENRIRPVHIILSSNIVERFVGADYHQEEVSVDRPRLDPTARDFGPQSPNFVLVLSLVQEVSSRNLM